MFLLSIVLGLAISCKGSKEKKGAQVPPGLSQGIELNKTKKEDLKEVLGAPQGAYELPSEGDRPVEVLDYKERGSYRFVDQKLESYFRNPSGEEESKVQYWRQKWSSFIVREEQMYTDEASNRDPILSQLINGQEKMTVVFEKLSGRVVRIVHYE